jgi:hypothetical protein
MQFRGFYNIEFTWILVYNWGIKISPTRPPNKNFANATEQRYPTYVCR